jgi:hypothetical protein
MVDCLSFDFLDYAQIPAILENLGHGLSQAVRNRFLRWECAASGTEPAPRGINNLTGKL